MASMPANPGLPIDPVLPGIAEALRVCPSLVLRAPTGAGKTTRVPLELMRAEWAADGWVVLVEPRRLRREPPAPRWLANWDRNPANWLATRLGMSGGLAGKPAWSP